MSSDEVPKWLVPESYAGLSDFSYQEWIVLLAERQEVEAWLEQQATSEQARRVLDLRFEALKDRRRTVLVADGPHFSLGDHPDRYTNRQHGEIEPLSVGRAIEYIAAHAERHPASRDSIQSFWAMKTGLDRTAFRSEHIEALGEPLEPSGPRLPDLICADLAFDRKQLTTAFAAWLAKRKPTVGSNTVSNRKINRKRWASYPVIPLLDLEQWARWSSYAHGADVRFSDSKKVEFLRDGFTKRAINERTLREGTIREQLNLCLAAETILRLSALARRPSRGKENPRNKKSKIDFGTS